MSESFSPITFDLTKELTMPNLSKVLGYSRQHVLALFEQLERGGFGAYTRGTRGKGKCSKFAPNDKCPVSFTILVDASTVPKRKRNDINKVTPQIETTTKQNICKTNVDEIETVLETKSVEAQIISSLWSLSKNIVKDSSSSFIGYECSVFANAFLVLTHVRGGGEKTIEEALRSVWENTNTRMGLKDKPKTKRVEQVASNLRGSGFYILDRAE